MNKTLFKICFVIRITKKKFIFKGIPKIRKLSWDIRKITNFEIKFSCGNLLNAHIIWLLQDKKHQKNSEFRILGIPTRLKFSIEYFAKFSAK